MRDGFEIHFGLTTSRRIIAYWRGHEEIQLAETCNRDLSIALMASSHNRLPTIFRHLFRSLILRGRRRHISIL